MDYRSIKIRRAEPADEEAVYRLICEMEHEELNRERFGAVYREQQEGPCFFCLVAEITGDFAGDEAQAAVIGCLNLRVEAQLHHAGRTAEIAELAVAEAHRSSGIGAELFQAACIRAEEEGCQQIEVSSNQVRLRAHKFYERQGMTKTHFKLTMELKSCRRDRSK